MCICHDLILNISDMERVGISTPAKKEHGEIRSCNQDLLMGQSERTSRNKRKNSCISQKGDVWEACRVNFHAEVTPDVTTKSLSV